MRLTRLSCDILPPRRGTCNLFGACRP